MKQTLNFNSVMLSKSRSWKGVWIPRSVYLSTLSWLEKILWLEIDYLSENGDYGCCAGNEYFSQMLGVSIPTITRSIKKLKDHGVLEEIGSDGRKRYLKTIKKPFDDLEEKYQKNVTNQNDYSDSSQETMESRSIKMTILTNQNDETEQSKRLANNIDKKKRGNKNSFSKEKENVSSFEDESSNSETQGFLNEENESFIPQKRTRKKSSRNFSANSAAVNFSQNSAGAPNDAAPLVKSANPRIQSRLVANQQNIEKAPRPSGRKESETRYRPPREIRKLIQLWNNFETTSTHQSNEKKKRLTALFKQLMDGTFTKYNKIDPEFIRQNNLPNEVLLRQWTVDEIAEVLTDLSKYSMNGYPPLNGDKKNYKDLERMLFNPRSGVSMFMKTAMYPPKPICEKTEDNGQYSEDLQISTCQKALIRGTEARLYNLRLLEQSLEEMRDWHLKIQTSRQYQFEGHLKAFNYFIEEYADYLVKRFRNVNLKIDIGLESSTFKSFLEHLQTEGDMYRPPY